MNKRWIWDFWAKRYEDLWVQEFSLDPTRTALLLYLNKILRKDQHYKILDVGCGIGQLLRDMKAIFNAYDLDYLGVDFSGEMVKKATQLDPSIHYQQMDVQDLPLLKEKFDIILCTHSFPYYEDQPSVMKIFRNGLKDNGILLLAQASQNNLYDHLILSFVKLTTGKATYPSVGSISEMTHGLFDLEDMIKINKNCFIPSIYLFILKGKTA